MPSTGNSNNYHYHRLRDELMHSKNGTTPFETMSVIFPTFLYTTFTVILVSAIQSYATAPVNHLLIFFIEFVTLVVPIILNVTVLAEHTDKLMATYATLILSSVLLMIFSKNNQSTKSSKSSNDLSSKTTDFLTSARSTISIISVIAILAVDFQIFPRRFAKTENFGFSLMDVGVGLFVYSNGIVDGRKPDLRKALKSSVPLLVIGAARFIVTRQIDYHVPTSEYGLHWNFFVTLAFSKIFVTLIMSTVSIEFLWINSVLLLVSHEILLQMGLKNFVLADLRRSSFIAANREGLVSCTGYVTIYLFSAYFGYFLRVRSSTNPVKTVCKFLVLSVSTLILTIFLERQLGISRKLANAAYCTWILFIGLFMTGLYYLAQVALKRVFEGKWASFVYTPLIFQAINYNGLPFFLLSNLLTGAINVTCDTLKMDAVRSLAIVIVYMLINCYFVFVLYRKRMKIKL